MVTRTVNRTLALGLFLSICGTACAPEIEDRTFLVDAPRVLAISAEPAEAKPGEVTSLRALYVDKNGTRADGPLDWALCRDRKPLTEPGVISGSCLAPPPAPGEEGSSPLTALGTGLSAKAPLFSDGCRVFGPDPPPPEPGQTPGRPVDPDFTGGYYLPLRIRELGPTGTTYSAGRIRMRCELSGATQEQFIEYNLHYRSNTNPTIATLSAGSPLRPVAEDPLETPLSVPPQAAVPLHVEWPHCPRSAFCGDGVCGIDEDTTSCAADCETPKGCEGSEDYLWFDPTERKLVRRREGVRVSWFASSGTFTDAHTGREEAGPDDPSSDNTWLAPAIPGTVFLWIVLRDDRGGVAWKGYRVEVTAP